MEPAEYEAELEREINLINRSVSVEDLLENYSGFCYWVGKMYEQGNTRKPADDIKTGKRVFWERLRELVGDDEPVSKTIEEEEVYEGMRVVLVNNRGDKEMPIGEKGTIVLPDQDGAPGVTWDTPKFNKIDGWSRDIKKPFSYMSVEDLEHIPDDEE